MVVLPCWALLRRVQTAIRNVPTMGKRPRQWIRTRTRVRDNNNTTIMMKMTRMKGEIDRFNRGMKTERNNEGNVTVRDADRLIATMTIHYTTTRIGIGYNDNATIL